MFVKQIEEARHTLADSIFVEAVLTQVWKSRENRFAYRTAGTTDRLTARLKLYGHTYGESRSVWPEAGDICHGTSPSLDTPNLRLRAALVYGPHFDVRLTFPKSSFRTQLAVHLGARTRSSFSETSVP